MSQQEALNTLVNALEVANKRGAFSLAESKQIADAIDTFKQQEKPPKTEPG